MNTEPCIKHGKFEYFGSSWTQEFINIIQPQLKELEWLIPNWAQYVVVRHNIKNKDDVANCGIDYGARIITLEICSGFFIQNEQERREILIHELIHGFTKVFADYARYIINKLLPDDDSNEIFKESIINELNERNESVTQDLAHNLRKQLYDKKGQE